MIKAPVGFTCMARSGCRTSGFLIAVAAVCAAWPFAAPAQSDGPARPAFVNPIAEGADPWVVQHGGKYIACQSDGNLGIAIHISDQLTAFGQKHVVWTAPNDGMCSKQIWAPELHFLDGRWYVYLAGSDGRNENHKMWALESAGADPLGPYTLHGPLYTGDHPETGADNRWAIDGTILAHNNQRFFVWSGWEDTRDEQWLYIAPMKDPLTVSGKRVRLCNNDDYLWERVDEKLTGRGLHEAPQILERKGRTFIVYSCSGSWQPSYKLGLLELRAGGDPMNPDHWIKHPKPVFESSQQTFGVGHNCFVKSPDGTEDWHYYHAKRDRRPGWRRTIYAQRFGWTAEGLPDFGAPVPPATLIPLPSGELPGRIDSPLRCAFDRQEDLAPWNYFGHHQFLGSAVGELRIGTMPSEPINTYRSGEKLVLAGGNWTDFHLSVTLRVLSGERDAGLLFRVRHPGVGYDAQEGYFAGIIPKTQKVILGSTDGTRWREIAIADAPIAAESSHQLTVTAKGPDLRVSVDGVERIRARDNRWTSGSIGLRVVDSEAAFKDLRLDPIR